VADVLVVEDERDIRELLRRYLERDGHSVMTTSTGAQALLALVDRPPDLVLLDLGLPDIDGLEVLAAAKAAGISVIALTARSSVEERIDGLSRGADDYVVKPFSPREVVARVKAILRRTPDNGHSLPSDTPFLIDRQRTRILFHGKPLELSRYEFRLLEILIARPGWVFSRDQLMEQAWEEPGASTDRTVDTHIKTIRAKLRKIKPNPDPILTHRGMGYSLSDSW